MMHQIDTSQWYIPFIHLIDTFESAHTRHMWHDYTRHMWHDDTWRDICNMLHDHSVMCVAVSVALCAAGCVAACISFSLIHQKRHVSHDMMDFTWYMSHVTYTCSSACCRVYCSVSLFLPLSMCLSFSLSQCVSLSPSLANDTCHAISVLVHRNTHCVARTATHAVLQCVAFGLFLSFFDAW